MTRCRRCGHPEIWHEGPAGGPQCPGCPCPGWSDPDPAVMGGGDPEWSPTDDDLSAAGMIGDGGPSAREATRAAWRQSDEAHR